MLCLSASWTTVLTFLPTILEEERGIAISAGSMLFGFMYYVLIPGGLLGSRIFQRITDRRLMVLLPAAMNTVFHGDSAAGRRSTAGGGGVDRRGVGVGCSCRRWRYSPSSSGAIRAREVSVLAGLVQTFSAIGFGGGPLLAGALAQASGSAVTGVLVVGGLTGLAILAAAMLPRSFGGSRYDVVG